MKYVLVALMVAALAASASAQGYNPSAKMFVHIEADAVPDVTDAAGVVNEIASPTNNTLYYAYLGFTELGMDDGSAPPEENGFTTVSFLINDLVAGYPGDVATQSFVNLLPGNLGIGDAFVSPGLTIASTECMLAPFQLIGYVQFFFLGAATGTCTIEILEHGDYPRWLVDCQDPGVVDFFCVWKNGALGTTAPAGDVGCEANTPVEDLTWSSIKALYR
jgi:hypothetical protein